MHDGGEGGRGKGERRGEVLVLVLWLAGACDAALAGFSGRCLLRCCILSRPQCIPRAWMAAHVGGEGKGQGAQVPPACTGLPRMSMWGWVLHSAQGRFLTWGPRLSFDLCKPASNFHATRSLHRTRKTNTPPPGGTTNHSTHVAEGSHNMQCGQVRPPTWPVLGSIVCTHPSGRGDHTHVRKPCTSA